MRQLVPRTCPALRGCTPPAGTRGTRGYGTGPCRRRTASVDPPPASRTRPCMPACVGTQVERVLRYRQKTLNDV